MRAEDTGHIITTVLGVALILTGFATLFRGAIVARLTGMPSHFSDG